jgi:antitoxin (DNA-binding transcriptional repressor) of toxin-antitoxin stability system
MTRIDGGLFFCSHLNCRFENRLFYILKLILDISVMKTISVREMKAHWSRVEEMVANGEVIEVLNHGKPRVRLVPAGGLQRVVWDDHLATAIPNKGVTVEETIARDRGGRW